jgi:hypothetical protein
MTDHTRHIGLFAPIQERITLIGAGGIGALTGLMLSKMSDSEITIYDNDTVDDVNIATQFHKVADMAKSENKAIAICNTMEEFSDSCSPYPHSDKFPDVFGLHQSKFVISAVDSITARKSIWEYLVENEGWDWYLDARMSAEVFQLYTVERALEADVAQYSRLLAAQNEEDIEEIACTMKATIYTAAIAAGHIGKTIRKIITGINPPMWVEHDIIKERILVIYGAKGRPQTV